MTAADFTHAYEKVLASQWVELQASQTERLRRNVTPLRLAEKPTKRDLDTSRAHLIDADERYELNTDGPFFYPDRHLKIDNTTLEPVVVAERIVSHFGLERTR